jgi:hypothetical protein
VDKKDDSANAELDDNSSNDCQQINESELQQIKTDLKELNKEEHKDDLELKKKPSEGLQGKM